MLPLQGPARLALLKLFTKILFAKSLRLMNPGLRGGDSGWLLHSAQAQRDRAEHPRVQDEPLLPAPIPLQDKSWGVPGHPNVPCGQLAKGSEHRRGHAQRRGLSSHIFIPASPGHRRHRHRRAARGGDAPSCSPPPHPPLLRELEASVV